MRAGAVEHEAEEKVAARGAESQRKDGAVPSVPGLAGTPQALLHPGLLLGLQARAGNAAVAGLIQERRKPEPPPEAPAPAEADQVATQPELAEALPTSGPEPGQTPGGAAEPGVPIDARPPPLTPDVSTAEPAAGLARVGGLPPAQLLGSLGSVAAAVDRDVNQQHQRLAASPPQRPRHPGAPSTVETPASGRLQFAERPAGEIPKVPEGHDAEVRRPSAPPDDPGFELKPGPLPHLPLEGNSDPAVVKEQQGHVLRGLEREHTSGQRDAAQPMGEDEIYPTAPAETLRAAVAQAPGANGHRPAPAAEDEEPASIVAQQEKAGEIHGAVSGGLASLAAERQEHEQLTTAERAKADAEMAQLERTNAAEQAGERAAARREVVGLRHEWTGAQQELVGGARREADAKTSETLQTVAQERSAADQQAAAHYEQGQREADQARRDGEQKAAAERKKAQSQSSGGLLGAIGSAAQSLFDKAKQAVQSVFKKATQLVRSAIERAQQLAMAVMERARQAIVGAIRLAGSALLAIGDRVLVAFPALRNRFRKAIQDRIAAAEAVVNKLATVLKQGIQAALNLLGSTLSAAIGLLQKGMQAAIDGVRAAVRGALDFARGALAAFGTFAVLVKDIAANPGRWISNLAAAVKDGIQNYLWVEIKTAVQGWFSDKVQEVVGVGQAIWHLLQRGGISIAEIARMAWEGLKAAIPGILIALLIEKLMSLIVPAVGAILTIIQSIQAAWGSLGRILQAFETFFAFLKQVKLGNAGPQFAKAVAAGAIAAVEFVSNFLLTRLKGAASSVSNRLRALARRIGERLAGVGRRILKGARAVGSTFRRAGQKVRAGFDRLRGKHPKSHADQERAKHERQEAAFATTKSKLDRLLAAGVSRAKLVMEVAGLKVRYRWGTLNLQGDPQALQVTIVGGFSPVRTVTAGQVTGASQTLEQMISRYPLAKTKLRQVRDDPFIPRNLKLRWMHEVEISLNNAHKKGDRPNPYDVMIEAVKGHSDNFLRGRRIPLKEIEQLGGLVRHASIRRMWTSLKPTIRAEYRGSMTAWIRKLQEDPSRFSPTDLRAGTRVPGVWWSAHRDSGSIGFLAVEQLRLERRDYPSGAVRFFLPPHLSGLPNLRKPTAFDGMFFRKFVGASGVWGIIPDGEAADNGIREGVSKTFVEVTSTTAIYIPPVPKEKP